MDNLADAALDDNGRLRVLHAAFVFVGNRSVHARKPIMELPHEEYEFPWLVSKAINGSPNFLAVWSKS